MYFDDYGMTLEWLDTAEFWADAWGIFDTAVGEDGIEYYIVRLPGTREIRYAMPF
jgi:hypothetical protein